MCIKFHHIAKAVATGAIAVLISTSFATAEQGGKYWTPTDGQSVLHRTSHARQCLAKQTATRKRPAFAQAATKKRDHHLILQVNTNDPAAISPALNHAANVAQS